MWWVKDTTNLGVTRPPKTDPKDKLGLEQKGGRQNANAIPDDLATRIN
jgi:hypothetical protein